MDEVSSAAALWWAVVASGVYHGINPGMGWPLAVSAALFEQRISALWRALAAIAAGHMIAMTAILLPFAVLSIFVGYQRELRLGAALIVIAMGVYLMINRRHPRALARIKPTRLALWSLLVATAHGAGLMLVPIYLGICSTVETDAGHAAAEVLMRGNVGIALVVALVHTGAMVLSGGAIAVGVHRWLGLKFLSRSWFNLDLVWALSLVLVGAVSLLAVMGG